MVRPEFLTVEYYELLKKIKPIIEKKLGCVIYAYSEYDISFKWVQDTGVEYPHLCVMSLDLIERLIGKVSA